MISTGSQVFIDKDITATIGKNVRDIPVTSSAMVTTYVILRASAKCS
jgi:hypothetical protein